MLGEGMNINLNFSEGLEGRVQSVQEELVIIFFEEIYLALSEPHYMQHASSDVYLFNNR